MFRKIIDATNVALVAPVAITLRSGVWKGFRQFPPLQHIALTVRSDARSGPSLLSWDHSQRDTFSVNETIEMMQGTGYRALWQRLQRSV